LILVRSLPLFDERPTLWQQLVVGFWYINLGLVGVLWATTADFGGLADWLDAAGMLVGLLAVYFALTQFMLMGRIGWLERHFGLDRLAGYHRINGYLAISFILVHPIFITFSYALSAHIGPIHQYADLITKYAWVWLALIGELLFITVVASSIYIARRRLKFETWYFVHLLVYLAIVCVSIHPFFVSDSFSGGEHPLAIAYWLGLYCFVALNLLIWRFGLPVYNWLRFGWRIDEVLHENERTTSIYIRGRQLRRWRSRPGQFVMVRIFTRGLWWQEHPFSLSWIPHDDRLRLTIRNVGDYTAAIAKLRPGARVLVSGPYGRFTREVARTDKRLFIAGGVGITPLRSLAEEALAAGQDCVLVYGNRLPDDVPLQAELAQLKLPTHHVYSDVKVRGSAHGYVDAGLIRRLVPDFKHRDVYLCGPPPMMTGIIDGLLAAGLDPAQLHYERFALHAG